ncbi:MAG: T9SS type A sorting domain-containing protein [Calditrichaeota bacterium]|nr:T9SS type A sorting domain-containing protein [Calditrichota bacterium]MCB9369182.1 T9SS type A sorting domain-containing protein [Calditrichota bacterium]
MKKMRLVLILSMAFMLASNALALESATLAFDETNQKMHLIIGDSSPFNAVVSFIHLPAACGLPQRWDESTGQYVDGIVAENTDFHWCELDMYVGDLAIGTPVQVAAEVQVWSLDWSTLEYTQPVSDWNEFQTTDGSTLEYLNDGCTPVLPTSIPINSAFCATLCHGTYVIPIECESPEHTPNTLEITVTNRCDPAEGSHCNNPDCPGVDWGLFNWNIRVLPNCLLYLTLSYCGVDPGCVCIWRSDFILPVEISGFTAVAGDGKVNLNWSTSSESDLRNFRVTRSTEREGVYAEMARFDASNNASGNNYSWTDENVANGTTYYYKLHVEDVNGNLSVYNIGGQTVVAEATPEAGAGVVDHCELAQNYPNPFNSQTSFSFSLPLADNVTLKVYDMLGREVATVVDGAMNAGTHTVNWSAEGLATGVYMYTLKAGNFSESKKLLYLK